MNKNYDDELNDIKGLKWFPHIGQVYDATKSKTLFVGESHYYDPDKYNSNNKEFTRMVVNELGVEQYDYGNKIPFFKRIAGIFDVIDRKELWSKVAFYNFVQRDLNRGSKVVQGIIERPTKVDFVNGWGIFVEIIKVLQPCTCIFFGNTSANYFNEFSGGKGYDFKPVVWEEKVGKSYLKRAEITIDGSKVELIFVRHPSSYFSHNWKQLLKDKFPYVFQGLK